MKAYLRRLVRRVVRRAGFHRTIAPTIIDIVRRHDIDVVLDIGANDGDFARDLRDAGYKGEIISFEPAGKAYGRLRDAAAADPAWRTVQLAFGETPGRFDLSLSAIDVYNSFKPPSVVGREAPGARPVATERVEVARLDAYLADHPLFLSRTYLKIDTQGFEAEVLRGAGDMLDKFAAVQAELALTALYENREDWLFIVNWMRGRGFEVATMLCNAVDRRVAKAIEYDVVFTRA